MTTIDSTGTRSLYTGYWTCVSKILGVAVTTKTAALKLNGVPPTAWSSEAAVRRLYESFEHPSWASPSNPSTENWVWRPSSQHRAPKSHEVRLERAVVAEDRAKRWNYQMSTASGYLSANADKRRSIDLVCRSKNGCFRFIELKIGRDQPLYAAFEVMGYGLAYLHARAHADVTRDDALDVLRARSIALEVLAPIAWYQRGPRDVDCDFEWLASGLNEGLGSLLAARRPPGLESMTFAFRSFPSPGTSMKEWRDEDYDAAARTIVSTYRDL